MGDANGLDGAPSACPKVDCLQSEGKTSRGEGQRQARPEPGLQDVPGKGILHVQSRASTGMNVR